MIPAIHVFPRGTHFSLSLVVVLLTLSGDVSATLQLYTCTCFPRRTCADLAVRHPNLLTYLTLATDIRNISARALDNIYDRLLQVLSRGILPLYVPCCVLIRSGDIRNIASPHFHMLSKGIQFRQVHLHSHFLQTRPRRQLDLSIAELISLGVSVDTDQDYLL